MADAAMGGEPPHATPLAGLRPSQPHGCRLCVAGKEELGWGDKHAVLALCEALAPFEMSWLASPPTPNALRSGVEKRRPRAVAN